MFRKIAVFLKWKFISVVTLFAAYEAASLLPGGASPATKAIGLITSVVLVYCLVGWFTGRTKKSSQRLLTCRQSGGTGGNSMHPMKTSRGLIPRR